MCFQKSQKQNTFKKYKNLTKSNFLFFPEELKQGVVWWDISSKCEYFNSRRFNLHKNTPRRPLSSDNC